MKTRLLWQRLCSDSGCNRSLLSASLGHFNSTLPSENLKWYTWLSFLHFILETTLWSRLGKRVTVPRPWQSELHGWVKFLGLYGNPHCLPKYCWLLGEKQMKDHYCANAPHIPAPPKFKPVSSLLVGNCMATVSLNPGPVWQYNHYTDFIMVCLIKKDLHMASLFHNFSHLPSHTVLRMKTVWFRIDKHTTHLTDWIGSCGFILLMVVFSGSKGLSLIQESLPCSIRPLCQGKHPWAWGRYYP